MPTEKKNLLGRQKDRQKTIFMFLKDEIDTQTKLSRVIYFQAPTNYGGEKESQTPLDLTVEAIHRSTLYWPLVISATAVYNVQSHLEPLLSIIVKPQITADQVIECKKVCFINGFI